jgi:ADP-ribosyl-[dinitrogen reductase] hydrolase
MPTRCERIEGGLLGLLIGDALGVPYEFHEPEEIPPVEQIEYESPSGFSRSHRSAPPGTWSDDGAQALCLLASLLECGRFDAEDVAHRLVRWNDEGYCAVDGRVFDIGIQTGRALANIRSGVPALQAGSTEERALGNGSLMRVLPLALWHRGTDAELVGDAQAQSRVTHGYVRAQLCWALYGLWARRLLADVPDAWASAVATLRGLYAEETPERAELEFHLRPDDALQGHGSGYVVDTLRSARWALDQGSYDQVVRAAIRLGHDTDTTACVAGGLAGVRDGVSAIPARWRKDLRGREICEPLLERLVAKLA